MNPVDIRLVELIQENSHLYNTADPNIKNYGMRAATFTEINATLATEFPLDNFDPELNNSAAMRWYRLRKQWGTQQLQFNRGQLHLNTNYRQDVWIRLTFLFHFVKHTDGSPNHV